MKLRGHPYPKCCIGLNAFNSYEKKAKIYTNSSINYSKRKLLVPNEWKESIFLNEAYKICLEKGEAAAKYQKKTNFVFFFLFLRKQAIQIATIMDISREIKINISEIH